MFFFVIVSFFLRYFIQHNKPLFFCMDSGAPKTFYLVVNTFFFSAYDFILQIDSDKTVCVKAIEIKLM